jgi:hypothetical protein
MSENYRLKTRRTMISLLGLFPWLSKFAFAAGSELLMAPCSFPFDASRLGTALDVQFRVNVYRNYIFTLEFHHNGGEDATRVNELVGNGNYKYFTQESADSDHPVPPEAPNTLEGVKQVQEGVRAGKVVTRATDFRGAIPIHIRNAQLECTIGVRSCNQANPQLISSHVKTLANRISWRAIPRHLAWGSTRSHLP